MKYAWLGVLCLGTFASGFVSAAPLNGRPPVDDIYYQFMPIAWRDSDNDTFRFGDFGGMTASLDYLQSLGVTAVWMTPIFPSPAYHGYQHGPADQVATRFGTEAGFLNFVAQAHARGIKVVLDYVVYGINRDYQWFQSAYNNPNSPYDDWLAFTNPQNTQYDGSTYTTWDGSTVRFIDWNLSNAGPVALVTGWAQHWLDPNGDGDPNDGIDGFRLDHVMLHGDVGNGWGYNLDTFWVPWKQALRTVNPDVFTFAEQGDWSSHGAELLPAFDATMTKPFEFAARSALQNESAAALYSEMATTVASLPAGKLYMGILGDHDVTRLASQIGNGVAKGKAAAAVLLTQPFPPMIYYGDELGMLGVKSSCSGDASDIAMREPFKWNAVAGPPMSNYWTRNQCALQHAFEHDNDGRSVEEQQGIPGSLLEEYKRLIAARKAHAALRRGTYVAVSNSTTEVWSFLRYAAGQETLLVAINVKNAARTPALDLSNVTLPGGSSPVQDVLSGQTLTNLTDANKGAYPLSLPAYGYQILTMNAVPNAPQPQVIDGTAIPNDVGPGALRATQNNATGMGDNVNELDQMFARVQGNGLLVGLTGNLATDGTGLVLFFDTVAGGQNVLATASIEGYGAVPVLDGMVLDAGCAADYALWINAYGGSVYANLYTLATTGGGTNRFVGSGTVNSGNGTLSGGTNPNGMLVALNNSNTAGVTGSSAAGAATATCGLEMFLPLADLGLATPAGTLRMSALLSYGDGNVGNQFLPGLGGGYGNLGYVPLDLNMIPGAQYVQIALASLPGDWNNDGHIDSVDFQAFTNCLSGPDGTALGPGCTLFDFDGDEDVDLRDFAVFQDAFTN
jgi:alpha-amylase